MKVTFKVTNVFKKNEEAYHDKLIRYIVNSGGSRSSKTYSNAEEELQNKLFS